MQAPRPYKLFISHAWKHTTDYERVVAFLNRQTGLEWDDLSVPRDKPIERLNVLARELNARVRMVDVVLVIARYYADESDWIPHEVKYARRIRRPIIGIMMPGYSIPARTTVRLRKGPWRGKVDRSADIHYTPLRGKRLLRLIHDLTDRTPD